ncbi:MAG: hypothetical protein GY750_19645 [Lentisphaerae bacterium]|nr:hypothetical protein [Lentisphaerota bacterium]MCP4103612.1 hypothetical protein [Lentisphaerota bacterium]
MGSYIHIFWTGPAFPYSLRLFIKVWANRLSRSKSHFKLIVWTTADTRQKIAEYLSSTPGCFLAKENFPEIPEVTQKGRINYNNFYIANFETILTKLSPAIQEMTALLNRGKLFPFTSDIARILIMNEYSGIYTDIGLLTPSSSTPFPVSIDYFNSALSRCVSKGFFMLSVTPMKRQIIENGALFSLPGSKKCLNEVLNAIETEYIKNRDYIKYASDSNLEFLSHLKTKALSRSFFKSDQFPGLLHGYHSRISGTLKYPINDYYKGVTHSDAKFTGKADDNPRGSYYFYLISQGNTPMVYEGKRMLHNQAVNLATFRKLDEKFRSSLTVSQCEYEKVFNEKITPLFESEDLQKQFEFHDMSDNPSPLYSWADPGFSRLSELDDAAVIVQRRWGLKKNYVSKSGFISIINRIGNSIPAEKRFHSGTYQYLNQVADAIKQQVRGSFIKEPMLTQVVCLIGDIRDEYLETFVKIINSSCAYMPIKKLIDPEKTSLTLADFIGFLEAKAR